MCYHFIYNKQTIIISKNDAQSIQTTLMGSISELILFSVPTRSSGIPDEYLLTVDLRTIYLAFGNLIDSSLDLGLS